MLEGLNKPHENKGESLKEIAKKVNDFLEPILEETFDLKSRKEYILANEMDFEIKKEKISDRAENLGFVKDSTIDSKMAKDILEADSEYKKINKLIKETKPEKIISIDLAEEIKKYDPDGKLEKEISKVYGFEEGIKKWRIFLALLNAALPEDPFFWDQLKENSESRK
jgi:hypothetical protein